MHIDYLDDLSGRFINFTLAAIFILFLSLLLGGDLRLSVPIGPNNCLESLVCILLLKRINELLLSLFLGTE